MRINVNGIADSYEAVGISQLGTAVFDNIVFPAGQYTDLQGNLQQYDEVVLDSVTVSVTRSKEIVRSKVSGREGSIKEYVTANDYIVTINALIAPETYTTEQLFQVAAAQVPGVQQATAAFNILPPAENTRLLELFARLEQVPERVAIRSKYLQNTYDINFVVITNFSQNKINADTYSLNITCENDKSIDLGDLG